MTLAGGGGKTKDLHSDLGLVQSITPQAVTAPVNGAGADIRAFEGVLVEVNLGTFGGTTPTATVKIQESPDDSTYTDVAAADLIGGDQLAQIDTTNDEQVYKRGYKGTKPYLRVAVTAVGGTSPSLPMSATIIKGHARHKEEAPVS